MMKEYTEVQLEQNYNKFLDIVKTNFSGERQEKILKLLSDEELGSRCIVAPASGREHFHYAYPGGYMDHVTNVCKAVHGVKKLFSYMGGNIDFTDEELVFSAFFHDLGKLGDETGEYYIPQDSEWHRTKQGEIFKYNSKIQNMSVTHRALYILQRHGITVSQKEWLGILLSDGIYDESNKFYLQNNSKEKDMQTNLPLVVHWADHISCRAEHDQWKFGN